MLSEIGGKMPIKRRRTYLLLLMATLLIVLGLGLHTLHHPTPARAAYDRLQIGMRREMVDEVLASVPHATQNRTPTTTVREWEGLVNGELHAKRLGKATPLTDPVLMYSLAFSGNALVIPEGIVGYQAIYRDGEWARTQHCIELDIIGKLCRVQSRDATIFVVVDQDDKLVEKELDHHGPVVTWQDALLDFWHRVWPL